MVKEERRERDRKPRKLAIKYVCMDAFTKSQARGNRAEFQRGRVALSLFLSLSLSLSLSFSRVAELLPVVFPRDEFITSSRFGKFQEKERKDTVAATRAGGLAWLRFFRRRVRISPVTCRFFN